MHKWLALTMLVALATPAFSQEVIYLIRHAEKAADSDDPALLPEGRDRAAAWAEMLANAALDGVVTSDRQRTMETGGIVAEALDLPVDEVPAMDVAGLLDLLSFDYEDGRVLVVAHTETIPSILKALGADEDGVIAPDEFGHLFVVTTGAPTVSHLMMPQ